MLLLDGLDEVPPARRAAILEAVDAAAAAGAVVVLSSRPSAANADELAPLGFRFFAAMPLRAEAVAAALDNAPTAEIVETPLALSLAKRALERGEAPTTRAELYSSAIDRRVAESRGGGAPSRLAREALAGVETARAAAAARGARARRRVDRDSAATTCEPRSTATRARRRRRGGSRVPASFRWWWRAATRSRSRTSRSRSTWRRRSSASRRCSATRPSSTVRGGATCC